MKTTENQRIDPGIDSQDRAGHIEEQFGGGDIHSVE